MATKLPQEETVTLEELVARAVDLAAGGTIPLMLVLLGVELTRVQLTGSVRAMQLSVALRLVIAPLIALLLAGLFGLNGYASTVALTMLGMAASVTLPCLA